MYRLAACLLFIFLTGCASSPKSESPLDYSHEKAIEVMLVGLEASALAMNDLHSATEKGKIESPDKAEFYDCVFRKINEDTLRKAMIPVYMKYYTKEDALEAIQILSTPYGKKFKAVMHSVANNGKQVVPNTPEEARELAKYSRFIQGPVIDKMSQELKRTGKRIGLTKAIPCMIYAQASL